MNNLTRLQALLLATFVTIIWSFSWVLIKFGLQDNIPPLTFAGLRYTLAACCLWIVILPSPKRRNSLKQINQSNLRWLFLLGFFYYTATQGLVFLSLDYLPAATYSLILNFTSIAVMIGGILFLNEYPVRIQYIGLVVFLCGAVLYFFPTSIPAAIGLLIGIASMVSNAVSSLLGRSINRRDDTNPLQTTLVSMTFGSLLLLACGLFFEGWQPISLQGWAIIIWLAIVHTAFAFTLWNISLQVLSATESSIINNTMLVQTALLAWLFLGENLSLRQVIALGIATIGILIFQLRKTRIAKVSS